MIEELEGRRFAVLSGLTVICMGGDNDDLAIGVDHVDLAVGRSRRGPHVAEAGKPALSKHLSGFRIEAVEHPLAAIEHVELALVEERGRGVGGVALELPADLRGASRRVDGDDRAKLRGRGVDQPSSGYR